MCYGVLEGEQFTSNSVKMCISVYEKEIISTVCPASPVSACARREQCFALLPHGQFCFGHKAITVSLRKSVDELAIAFSANHLGKYI